MPRDARGGIAGCERGAGSLCPPGGTEVLCPAPGVVWGLSPCPGHTLAVHGHRCLTPGLQSPTGGATLIRIRGDLQSALGLFPARLYPQPIRTRPGHGHSPAGAWPWVCSALRVEHKLVNCWPKPAPNQTGAKWGQIVAFLGHLPPPSPCLLYPSLPGH